MHVVDGLLIKGLAASGPLFSFSSGFHQDWPEECCFTACLCVFVRMQRVCERVHVCVAQPLIEDKPAHSKGFSQGLINHSVPISFSLG